MKWHLLRALAINYDGASVSWVKCNGIKKLYTHFYDCHSDYSNLAFVSPL